jgi:RNA polymerase sigma factor for flagellar operon FliA
MAELAPLTVTTDMASLTTLYGGWVKRMAVLLKSRMPWAELDELLQWGAIGMMESMQRYDISHGVTFQAFASRRIRGAMIDGLRREGASRRGHIMFEPEDVDHAAVADGTAPQDPLSLLTNADNRTLLIAALKTLPRLEYQILAMHFYDDMNNREIAAILDVSEGYASRLRKRALESLAITINAAHKGNTVP